MGRTQWGGRRWERSSRLERGAGKSPRAVGDWGVGKGLAAGKRSRRQANQAGMGRALAPRQLERGDKKKVSRGEIRRQFEFSEGEHVHGAGVERGEVASPSDRAAVTVGSDAGGDTRRGGGVGRAYHEATESLGHGVFQQDAEAGPHGTAHSGSVSGSGDGIEGQECAEEDADSDDTSCRSHVGVGGTYEPDGVDDREVWRPERGILGTPVVLWELQAQAKTGWNMDPGHFGEGGAVQEGPGEYPQGDRAGPGRGAWSFSGGSA